MRPRTREAGAGRTMAAMQTTPTIHATPQSARVWLPALAGLVLKPRSSQEAAFWVPGSYCFLQRDGYSRTCSAFCGCVPLVASACLCGLRNDTTERKRTAARTSHGRVRVRKADACGVWPHGEHVPTATARGMRFASAVELQGPPCCLASAEKAIWLVDATHAGWLVRWQRRGHAGSGERAKTALWTGRQQKKNRRKTEDDRTNWNHRHVINPLLPTILPVPG